MKFDGKTLEPHAEVQHTFRQMKSLSVKAGGKEHKGEFEATLDDHYHLTLDFGGGKKLGKTMSALKKKANGA